MRFQVPQFIGIEDKIFGPLTAKQFVYLAGGAGLCYLIFRFLPLFIAIILVIPIGGFVLALAFYKVNNKPFIFILEAGLKYFFNEKFYVWKKIPNKIEKVNEGSKEKSGEDIFVPKLSESKLKEITWSLDVKKNLDKFGRETK